MPRECPGCGATATLEARFCRRCGRLLKGNGGHDTDSPISPMAQTVPLADEGRTTDGLWAEESHELASGTSRIRRTEMEDLLRRVSREHDGDGLSRQQLAQGDGSALDTPPLASTLQTPSAAAPSDNTASTSTTTTTARSPRRLNLWHWAIFTLLSMTLAAGLLGFIAYRRSRVTSAASGDTPVAPVSEEKQTGASTAEAAPQPEQATTSAPSSPVTTAGPEHSTARGTEAAARPSSEVPAASRTTPAPALETSKTTPTSPPALSANDHYQRGVRLWEGDRRAALEEFRAAAAGGVADAYFYLGTEYYPAGRDPGTLSEGELRAALNYFLRATSGPHSAQASRSAQALGKEYERRKKQSRR